MRAKSHYESISRLSFSLWAPLCPNSCPSSPSQPLSCTVRSCGRLIKPKSKCTCLLKNQIFSRGLGTLHGSKRYKIKTIYNNLKFCKFSQIGNKCKMCIHIYLFIYLLTTAHKIKSTMWATLKYMHLVDCKSGHSPLLTAIIGLWWIIKHRCSMRASRIPKCFGRSTCLQESKHQSSKFFSRFRSQVPSSNGTISWIWSSAEETILLSSSSKLFDRRTMSSQLSIGDTAVSTKTARWILSS